MLRLAALRTTVWTVLCCARRSRVAARAGSAAAQQPVQHPGGIVPTPARVCACVCVCYPPNHILYRQAKIARFPLLSFRKLFRSRAACFSVTTSKAAALDMTALFCPVGQNPRKVSCDWVEVRRRSRCSLFGLCGAMYLKHETSRDIDVTIPTLYRNCRIVRLGWPVIHDLAKYSQKGFTFSTVVFHYEARGQI